MITAVPALGATKHGITPVSPAPGATVAQGTSPTFKGKNRGKGPLWVYVCGSKKRDSRGLICNDESITRAKRTPGGRFKAKPRFFDFPEFWLNTPGTYFWQAHRIECTGESADCSQEGPVVKFKVG
jgi:hypothetical protein